MRIRFVSLLGCLMGLLLVVPAWGQDASSTPAGPAFAIGPINFSGTVDGYYSFNNNHPASRINTLHNFDVSANSFDLNFAKMKLEMAPDPIGFVFDFGFGTGMEVFSAGEPGNSNVVGAAGVVSNNFLNHVTQAYLSLKPPSWGGLQLDFGKFYTSAGAELTETYTNWNYSRSLLFTNGPFYHFGARASMPVGEHFVLGGQLVNGWNNVFDNNVGKTGGINGVVTFDKVVWANSYYFGPENSQIDPTTGAFLPSPAGKGFRHFFDTALTVTPSDMLAFYINYDYGYNKIDAINASAVWYALSIAGKIGPQKTYFAPRFEVYKDINGFITGTAQEIKEFTATLNHEIYPGILTKFEYRRDWSDAPFFAAGQGGFKTNQDTALLGLVFYFPWMQ